MDFALGLAGLDLERMVNDQRGVLVRDRWLTLG